MSAKDIYNLSNLKFLNHVVKYSISSPCSESAVKRLSIYSMFIHLRIIQLLYYTPKLRNKCTNIARHCISLHAGTRLFQSRRSDFTIWNLFGSIHDRIETSWLWYIHACDRNPYVTRKWMINLVLFRVDLTILFQAFLHSQIFQVY